MRHPWPLLVLAVVLACGGEGDGPASPGPVMNAFADPRGDTLASQWAVAQAHDVVRLEALPDGDSLRISVRFTDVVQPYSTRAENAVLGIVDIDVDDDPKTGHAAYADGLGATSRIGAEWSLFLEDSTAGADDRWVALVNRKSNEIVWVPSRFSGVTVTASVPLALLHFVPGASMRIAGAFGSIERVSDIVPNEGSLLVAMP